MNITVIGAGYVGLVSGVCLADLGFSVTCVDKNDAKITMLEAGRSPIYEPGLEAMMAAARTTGRLAFTTDLLSAVAKADIVMLAVGTPPDPGQEGRADLRHVFAAAEQIAPALSGYTVLVTKSTVPVGTNERIEAVVRETNPEADCDIASNPEFLREGSAIADFMQPDRIIVGVSSDRAAYALSDLYRPLTNKGYALLTTDIRTAEMIKYASNSFLASKIAFINEMADICEYVGANVELVAKGMGMDSRIGDKFLQPGPGFGGSCFPKDALALVRLAEEAGIHPHILNTVISYNLGRRETMAERIIDACGGSVEGKTIAVLGLTFKANTDDMRESPALVIIPHLLKAGACIKAYDPEGMDNAKPLLEGKIEWSETLYDAAEEAEALAILTEWEAFRTIDLKHLRKQLAHPLMIDLRNLYSPSVVAGAGFDYYSIGRKPALGHSGSAVGT